MTTALAAVAGTLTTPAALTLQPPPGGALWGVWVNADNAVLLAEDLIGAHAHFGQQTWPDDDRALMVVFVTMPASEALRAICVRYGPIRHWAAGLDVTGVWEEYRP